MAAPAIERAPGIYLVPEQETSPATPKELSTYTTGILKGLSSYNEAAGRTYIGMASKGVFSEERKGVEFTEGSTTYSVVFNHTTRDLSIISQVNKRNNVTIYRELIINQDTNKQKGEHFEGDVIFRKTVNLHQLPELRGTRAIKHSLPFLRQLRGYK